MTNPTRLIARGCRVISYFPTIASVAVLVVLLVFACAAPVQPLVPSEKPRIIASFDLLPIISTATHGATTDIDIYLSPSCPTCIRLYYETVIQGRLLSKSFDNANISFILVPLVDRDHETIKNIMCVETTQRYSAIGKLYSEARIAVGAQNGFNQGDMNRLADRLVQISREVAHSYGLSESDLAKCQSSKDLELAIIATWEHGWAKNRERDWPFVMVNGKSTLIKTSAALTAAAEGR